MTTAYPVKYDDEEVRVALNRAADDIATATGLAGSGVNDALNLLVNATLAYLTGMADTLSGVVALSYEIGSEEMELADADAPLDVVLGWIKEGA